ncbi:MAG: S41 family peptidase [Gemmatimonadota bacterium]
MSWLRSIRMIPLFLLTIGAAVPLASQAPTDSAPHLPLDEIIHLIATNYRVPISSDSLYRAALHGILGTLDQYSKYYSPDELKAFHQRLDGKIGGIGIQLAIDRATARYVIAGVFPDSPAQASGLEAQDTILAVNDHRVTGDSLDAVMASIQGTPGTVVHLAIRRRGQSALLHFTLTRAVVELHPVRGSCRENGKWQYYIDAGRRIAYIEITGFTTTAPAELDSALAAVSRTGARGLILDMRDNGGGLIEASEKMADFFLDTGSIVTVQWRGRADSTIKAEPGGATAIPLVILVNENTGSAAELFTASLQDNGRATVIGARTFGKGVYQHLYDLPDSGALRLTPGAYLRPSGRPIERHAPGADSLHGGVWPDSGMTIRLSEAENQRRNQVLGDRDSGAGVVGGLACPSPSTDDRALMRAVEVLSARPH